MDGLGFLYGFSSNKRVILSQWVKPLDVVNTYTSYTIMNHLVNNNNNSCLFTFLSNIVIDVCVDVASHGMVDHRGFHSFFFVSSISHITGSFLSFIHKTYDITHSSFMILSILLHTGFNMLTGGVHSASPRLPDRFLQLTSPGIGNRTHPTEWCSNRFVEICSLFLENI